MCSNHGDAVKEDELRAFTIDMQIFCHFSSFAFLGFSRHVFCKCGCEGGLEIYCVDSAIGRGLGDSANCFGRWKGSSQDSEKEEEEDESEEDFMVVEISCVVTGIESHHLCL
jgi:hypothetical protein